jgi:hypothetical protein
MVAEIKSLKSIMASQDKKLLNYKNINRNIRAQINKQEKLIDDFRN